MEGDTLADRLTHGRIPVEESLKLALQIGDALKAAHENGVIHRDLKPANIKVTDENSVKVLDFGLAKAFAGEEAEQSPSNSPTLSMQATQQGVILGTAAYMSPEQARGKSVDRRADIWAFGVVLYEMLTGQQAFADEDVSMTLSKVLQREPDFDRLPAEVPARVAQVLKVCLQKDAKQRIGDVQALRLALDGAFETVVTQVPETAQVETARQSKLGWGAALLVSVAVTASAVWVLRPPAAEVRNIARFVHILPEDQALGFGLAVSSDGTQIVYAANQQLYLRDLAELVARPIAGTDEAPQAPFFSPDNASIGYWSADDRQLKKIAIGGGVPVTLADTPAPSSAPNWREDDTIVFGGPDGVMRVSSDGGLPAQLLPHPGTGTFRWPQILPGGNAVLLSIGGGGPGEGQIVIQPLDSGEPKELFPGVQPRYISTGHIVYGLEDVLYAVPFDVETLAVTGGAVPLVEGVRGGRQYVISDSGTLVYIPGPALTGDALDLAFLDRQGNPELFTAPAREYIYPRLSPDDTRVAVEVADDDGSNIWIFEIEGSLPNQLKFDGGSRPIWSPDGTEVAFLNEGAIWTVPADFTGTPTLLPGTEVEGNQGPGSWSPDGTVLLFVASEGIHAWQRDSASEDASEAEVIVGATEEATVLRSPEFSPDGSWFVYASNRTETTELYASPYPVGGGGRQRITTDTGVAPVWVRERDELIYQQQFSAGLNIQALPITTQPTLARNNPVTLFSEMGVGINFEDARRRNFDVSADGQQFIVAMQRGTTTGSESQISPRINIVLNWFEELKERVPFP